MRSLKSFLQKKTKKKRILLLKATAAISVFNVVQDEKISN